MMMTIRSTTKIVTANGIQCRVWEGVTEKGVKVQALIPRVAVQEGQDVSQFERELEEHAAPTPEVEAWPLRMIL